MANWLTMSNSSSGAKSPECGFESFTIGLIASLHPGV